MSKSCRNCGLLTKDCTCYAKKEENDKPKTDACGHCHQIHHTKYLRHYESLQLCASCLTVAQLDPATREFYRTLSVKYKLPLVDMILHNQVANIQNMGIEDYLVSLPRSREAFKQYFAGRDIQIGGVSV